MAKKMDFVEFISDLPDEEGDAPVNDVPAELQGPIPTGIYYSLGGSRMVLVNEKGCKKQQ